MIRVDLICSICLKSVDTRHVCAECRMPICKACWMQARKWTKYDRICKDCEVVYDDCEVDY